MAQRPGAILQDLGSVDRLHAGHGELRLPGEASDACLAAYASVMLEEFPG